MPKHSSDLNDSPFTTTPEGTVILNASHLFAPGGDPDHLLRAALAAGHTVFIGVVATPAVAARVMSHMTEAAHEAVAISYRERG